MPAATEGPYRSTAAPRPAPPGATEDDDPFGLGDDTRGSRRLGWLLAGVVAIIAVAGAVVIATSDDDEPDTAGPASEVGDSAESTVPSEPESPPAGSDPDVTEPADAGETTESPGDAGVAAESPVDVAEAFFAAVEEGDCQGIVDRMTVESFSTDGQTADEAVAECEADTDGLLAISSAEFVSIEPVSEDGDAAVVSVTQVADGKETVRELPLERVDGVWKMDLDPTAAPPAD